MCVNVHVCVCVCLVGTKVGDGTGALGQEGKPSSRLPWNIKLATGDRGSVSSSVSRKKQRKRKKKKEGRRER